jgi:predicted MPP superfamily phosphohydrolase
VGLIKESERRYAFVSKGIGTFFIPVRLHCPPDIGVIQLKSA